MFFILLILILQIERQKVTITRRALSFRSIYQSNNILKGVGPFPKGIRGLLPFFVTFYIKTITQKQIYPLHNLITFLIVFTNRNDGGGANLAPPPLEKE